MAAATVGFLLGYVVILFWAGLPGVRRFFLKHGRIVTRVVGVTFILFGVKSIADAGRSFAAAADRVSDPGPAGHGLARDTDHAADGLRPRQAGVGGLHDREIGDDVGAGTGAPAGRSGRRGGSCSPPSPTARDSRRMAQFEIEVDALVVEVDAAGPWPARDARAAARACTHVPLGREGGRIPLPRIVLAEADDREGLVQRVIEAAHRNRPC